MNRSVLTMAIATIPLAAGSLARLEREFLFQHPENSKGKLLDAVKELSESQMNFKPTPDRWSVAECLEHVAASEEFIRQIGFDPAIESPFQSRANRSSQGRGCRDPEGGLGPEPEVS